mgnify:CR=1 FL=1
MASNIKARDVVKGMFSSYAPVTVNTLSSTREVAQDAKTISRQVITGMRQSMANADKSSPGRKAIALFNAAKESLRNGSFEIEQANDDMYEDYESYESDFSLDNMTDDERAETSPEEIILRGNRGIAKTVIRASTAQLEGMKASQQKILMGTLKGMEASTKSINATIVYSVNILSTQLGIANTKLDAINKNLVSLIEYQNENTTVYYQKNLEMMEGMLQSMSNLAAMSQGKGARDLKNFNFSNGFNVKEYLKRVKKGIKNSTMVSGAGTFASLYKMAEANPEIMSPGEMIGQSIPGILSMIPAISSKFNRLSSIDNRIKRYITETMYKIGDKFSGNMFAAMLGLDSLGNKRRTIGGINMSAYMKDQLPWNGKAQKALTEVIPELLTSIDAGINKTDKRYFDYNEGNWKSRKELDRDFADQISNTITLEFSSLMDKVSRKLNQSGKSESEIAEAKKKMNDIISDRIYNQGDIQSARQDMAGVLEDMKLSQNEFSSVFNSMEESISAVTESISELYARIGSTDSVLRNINNRSGGKSSEAIGQNAFRKVIMDRKNNTNIFGMTFTTDVKSTMSFIENEMKTQDSEFRLSEQNKRDIMLAINAGKSDLEILRMMKNQYGKKAFQDKVQRKVEKTWAKIRHKEYIEPNRFAIDDSFDDFGNHGNAADMFMLEKVYGIKTGYRAHPESKSKTVQPQKNQVGAASSRATRDAGKTAGAGTNTQSQATSEGKSFTPEIDGKTEDLKSSLIDDATQNFDKAMNSTEGDLQKSENLRKEGAELAEDIAKEGSTSLGGALKNFVDSAVLSMSSMFSSFTSFGSRLFGKEGLIANFFKSEPFKKGINKLKHDLFDEKTGVFGKQVAGFRKWRKETWEKTKDKLVDAYDWAYDKYSTYKYSNDGYQNYRDNPAWQNSKLMQSLDIKSHREAKKALAAKESEQNVKLDEVEANEAAKVEDAKSTNVKHVKSHVVKKGKNAKYVKSFVPEIQRDMEETKSSIEEVSKEAPEVLKESVNKIAEAGTESAEELKSSAQKVTTAMVGDPKEKPEQVKTKYAKTFNETIKKALPKIGAGAIIGAGVGMLNGFGGHSLLGSMFLPTGIIGGGIVGAGLTLITQTEAFKSLMFGKKNEETGERSGGLISKELKDKFKKAAPIAVGGAVAGALKSIITSPITGGKGLGILGMQLLPGGILGGAILGMGVGLLKNSETFKNVLFGKKDEDGKRTGTWLSKSYEAMKKKMSGSSEFLKNGLKGAGIGAVTGATMLHMGAIPAAMSMGGPVGMGIMGLGLGIAASTKKFNSWLFGEEEFDDDGKSLGRKGGVLGRVKNLINVNVVEPISATFKSAMFDMIDWTKDKITLPFRTAFGPIMDSIKGIKDNVVDFVSDKFTAIGDSIMSMMKKTLSTLFSPITKLIGNIGKAMIGGAKVGLQVAAMPLTAGLSAMNFLTSGKRMKENAKFYKEYYTQGGLMKNLKGYWDAEQADYDEEAAATGKKAKRVGFFDKASDFLSALTGNGVVADAARKGYNNAQTDGGQNSLDWRSVFRERKELKANRRARHDSERKWNEISKLGRNIANRDLHGRNVTLTDSMYKKYRDKFVKLGIDPSLINSNDDLMQLIYNPQKFRANAASGTSQNEFMAALQKYRITPEEEAAMKETAKYQTNVQAKLDEISKQFYEIGQEVLFDRQTSSYFEDRKHDKRKLKNQVRRVSKSTLWQNKRINFDDPELEEYDIEGLTDDDLMDYAASNYADNNDFKGWLASIGRKMSPDDNRMQFVNAKRSWFGWKRSSGKTSTEPAPEKSESDTTAELTEAVKEQTEIAEANMMVNVGGKTNAKKVMDKVKSGSLDAKTANKFSLTGMINNVFNRKAKAEKKAARDAREAAESADAQALGDKKETDETKDNQNATINTEKEGGEKKQSIFSKIFGALGAGVGWFGTTALGSAIFKGIKLLGPLALMGGIGLTIAELIKPGIATSIGNTLTAWNDETKQAAEDGTVIDLIKSKVSGWFDTAGTFLDEKVLSEDGYIVKGAQKVADTVPTLMENFVVPSITRASDFIANNAETLVGAAGTVITAIAPPLAEAVSKVIPSVVGSTFKGFGSNFFGWSAKTKGQKGLTDEQKSYIKENGGSYRTGWVTVSEEEAQQYQASGYNVKSNGDGTYDVYMDYTVDSNIYVDKNGKDRKRTNQSALATLGTIAGRLGVNALTGRGAVNKKLLQFAGKGIFRGFGSTIGSTMGILGGPTGMMAGGSAGWKLGGSLYNKLGNLGTKAINAVKSGGSSIANFFKAMGGKAAKETAEEGSEAALKALTKAATNTAGTGIDDVAKVALKEKTNFINKIINIFKNLSKNEAIIKVIKRVGGTKVGQLLSAISKWASNVVKKLIGAIAEMAKNSALGKKIGTLVGEKLAKAGAKGTAAGLSAGITELVFVSIGAITGAMDAANMFEVSKDQVDWKMRIISGLLQGIMATTVGAFISIGIEIVQLFTGFNAIKWTASMLYKYISLDSEKSKEKLQSAQDALAIETQIYNEANGTNLSPSEYNDIANKTTVGKAIGFITGSNVDTSEYRRQAQARINNTNSTNKSATNKNNKATKSSNSTQHGSGRRSRNNRGSRTVGYGSGDSQGNSAWASMPIGKFANGEVSTMKTGGCGPTAMSTIANMFGAGTNPAAMGAYAASNGYINNGGATEDLFTKGAAAFGIANSKVNKSNFDAAINSSSPMAISGTSSGPFTRAGHVVVARGTDKHGNVNVIDPKDGRSHKYSKSALKSGMTNAWAYSKPIGYGPEDSPIDGIATGMSSESEFQEDPTTLGGIVSGFRKLGNIFTAVLGTIKGEGTFSDLYSSLNGENTGTLDNALSDVSAADIDPTAEREYIWKYLRKQGYNPYAAAGIMGCWNDESGNKAKTIEGYFLKKFPGYDAVLASSEALDNYTTNILFPAYHGKVKKSAYKASDGHYYPGFGYAQWTGGRGLKLLNHAKSKGLNWATPEGQLSYFTSEMSGSYSGTKNKLSNVDNVKDATMYFFDGYEMGKNAHSKYPQKFASRYAAAQGYYNQYKNVTGTVVTKPGAKNKNTTSTFTDPKKRFTNTQQIMGPGPVGFGPDDGPSNWNEFLSGASAMTTHLQNRLTDMGLGDLFSGATSSISSLFGGTNNDISYDDSAWKNNPSQYGLVAAMNSIRGKIKYSLSGPQNPDRGSASCASTVGWAYRKVLGDKDSSLKNMSASSTAQATHPSFTTIWANNGSGLSTDFINKYLRPGDILYQNWSRTSNNGKMNHTEMYAGNGADLSHGGPGRGPVIKTLDDHRRKHTMMIRRYNGFMNNGSSTTSGTTTTNNKFTNTMEVMGPGPKDQYKLENNFIREMNKQHDSKNHPNPHGEGAVGYGNGDSSSTDTRLDKILTVITDWYLASKKSNTTVTPQITNNTNTVVNNTNNQVSDQKTPTKPVKTNIDKLAQRNQAYAKMYKSNI